MAEEKYNMRNPAVKRILQEVREMQNNASEDFMSLPLQDNIFEWQFAIRGPQDTEFEGGIYHGRIQLPPEYPFRPPAFMLLTPNGRFQTQTKICLSISQHHPEHWQPSWSVRTALVALIAFLPTKPDGALGSLDYTSEERRALAIKSRAAAPKFGTTERQQLIDEIHEYMLKKAPPVPEMAKEEQVQEDPSEVADPAAPTSVPVSPAVATEAQEEASATGRDREENLVVENVHELRVNANAGPIAVSFSAGFRVRAPAPVQGSAAREQPAAIGVAPPRADASRGLVARLGLNDDFGLTVLAIGLTIAIIALLIKKYLALAPSISGTGLNFCFSVFFCVTSCVQFLEFSSPDFSEVSHEMALPKYIYLWFTVEVLAGPTNQHAEESTLESSAFRTLRNTFYTN
ncbi:hypothetical protein R1flu_020393 [Riccia fluitans]|uniref:UBC core domain-containing protein n=1 Tax=Riccia fluitans TaxID=41844 RepID=A0ABD1ZMV9_9MARC